MKSTDLRAKARAIFGSAIAEPMPNQPNGAKALQQRANARPIPTYKVGGVVKSTPPGPTAAEREEARRQNERLKKAKVTPKEGKVIDSANRSEGMYKKGGKAGCYSEGGRMKGSTDSARMKGSTDAARMKGSTDSARMSVTPDEKRKKITLNEKRVRVPSIEYKKGGAAKSKPKDGLAVMIAIGKPMKGMKKPVKKALGGAMGMSAPSARQMAVKPPSARRVAADELRAMQQARLAAKQKPLRQEANPSVQAGPMRGPIQIPTGPKREQMPIQAQKPIPMVMDKAAEQRRLAGIIAAEAKPGMKKGGSAMKKPVKKALGGGMDAKLSKAITAAAPKVSPTKGPEPQRILGTSMLAGVKNTGGISRVAPARMGAPVKRAVGGAGKTRKGMC